MSRLLAVVLLFTVTRVHTEKILAVFPTPSVSHQVVFRPLTQELARRGHDVTVITTDPIFSKGNSPKNFTEIDLHDVSYNLWKEKFVHNLELGNKDNTYQHMEFLKNTIMEVICLQMEQTSIQQLIKKKEKFDLLLLESWPRPALVYSHLFKAPLILISSLGGMLRNEEEIVGATTHPLLYPLMLQQRLYNLSFSEKLHELLTYQRFNKMWYNGSNEEVDVFRQKFGINLSYDDIIDNIDMLFINTHPMWTNNQPLPPNVITIWGIHRNPAKPLPADLKKYLDSSENGVVYLSFGTNVLSSMLPPEKIQMLINVFSRLQYDVLWKWETDVLPGKSDNIKISKWLPQSDLLKHPKIKLFITQGGLQSTDEAITAGVPMIGVPMLADQWFNVEKYVYHKIGIRLDLETLTEEDFETAIHTIINDTSYRDNVIRLRSLMYDQPETSLERAVWWTEYVLRHGGAKHLRAAGANLLWTEYYEVYFFLKLASLILSAIIVLITVVHLLWNVTITKVKVKVS